MLLNIHFLESIGKSHTLKTNHKTLITKPIMKLKILYIINQQTLKTYPNAMTPRLATMLDTLLHNVEH